MRSKESRLLAFSMFCAAVGLVTAGCAQQQEPVGRLSAGSSEIQLSYPAVAQLELNWGMSRVLEGLEGNPIVFLHLLDADGDVVRTFDHDFPTTWRVGEEHSYSVPIYQSALAPSLDEGTYKLTAGLYDRSGKRWSLESAGPERAQNEYEISSVVVNETGPQMPQFFFSSTWLTIEGGTDLQTLGRRWLTDDGVIRLGGLTAPGRLWLVLGIPKGGGALQAPVFAEGATEQRVTVTTTCGDAAVQVTGPGSHPAELPIALPTVDEGMEVGPTECEVSFAANFHMLSRESDERRTVALEGLSWSTLD